MKYIICFFMVLILVRSTFCQNKNYGNNFIHLPTTTEIWDIGLESLRSNDFFEINDTEQNGVLQLTVQLLPSFDNVKKGSNILLVDNQILAEIETVGLIHYPDSAILPNIKALVGNYYFYFKPIRGFSQVYLGIDTLSNQAKVYFSNYPLNKHWLYPNLFSDKLFSEFTRTDIEIRQNESSDNLAEFDNYYLVFGNSISNWLEISIDSSILESKLLIDHISSSRYSPIKIPFPRKDNTRQVSIRFWDTGEKIEFMSNPQKKYIIVNKGPSGYVIEFKSKLF